MATFFIMQPVFMLSGFTVPIRNMPEGIAYLTYLNPLRYFMEIVRGVFLKGSGFDVLWPHLAALMIFGLVIMTLSVVRFKKRTLRSNHSKRIWTSGSFTIGMSSSSAQVRLDWLPV
jgi:ABC-2 type transport system permease protein